MVFHDSHGSFLFFETEGLRHHTGVEHRVHSHGPVLVDKLEIGDSPSQFHVHPSHSLTDDAVSLDATSGSGAAISFGIYLLVKHEVSVHHRIVWDVACKHILSAQTIAECEFVANHRDVMMEDTGKCHMTIIAIVNKIRGCRQCSLKIDTSCRVVFIVFRIVDNAGLKLGNVAFLLICTNKVGKSI